MSKVTTIQHRLSRTREEAKHNKTSAERTMEPQNQSSRNGSSSEAKADPTIQKILESLKGLRFGSVNIIVQDGKVIQIDRVEKFRLTKQQES